MFEIIINIVIGFCVLAIFTSIIINFVEGCQRKNVKREKKSIVETGTMTLFFLFFYAIIRFHIGTFHISSTPIYYLLSIIGTFIVITGCIVNIRGRFDLGKNWANQIKIYQDHALVKTGVYQLVRHPLYASLIWMYYGCCLVYLNAAALAANTLIFLPFMYYRASQEEKLLTEQFEDYNTYKQNTGMFFPKFRRRSQNESM